MDNPPEISPAPAAQRDAEANQHLLRGLALLETNTPASLREAVPCFDAAIKLRRQLPLAANPWFRYGLIAGWMNRGDALTRLGSPTQLTEALQSFDEALAELRQLPLHESPLFVKRLAIAWLNRGVTLLAYDSPNASAEAAANFSEAIAAAENFAAKAPDEGHALLAGAWLNRGNALIRLATPDFAAARAAAKEALAVTACNEQTNPGAAELGFKARHICCQALAGLLASPESSPAARDEFLAEATDVVDDGLTLARQWRARGETRFAAAVTDLFCFGCRAYQLHQPHFLTEFLLENLDPTTSDKAIPVDQALHTSAVESLWQTLGALHRDSFRHLNTPKFEQTMELFRELRITKERLAALQQRFRPASS